MTEKRRGEERSKKHFCRQLVYSGVDFFAFENTLSDPFVLPNGAKLNSLLYADDLIILSRSKTGLQNCLDKLSSFCTSWMMKINPKNKNYVFQKRT